MSDLHENLPPVIVKESKMFPYSTCKTKAAIVALCIIFCLYLLLLLRTEYVKSRKLDRVAQMLAQSEKDLLYLEKLDRELDSRIRSLRINYDRF